MRFSEVKTRRSVSCLLILYCDTLLIELGMTAFAEKKKPEWSNE